MSKLAGSSQAGRLDNNTPQQQSSEKKTYLDPKYLPLLPPQENGTSTSSSKDVDRPRFSESDMAEINSVLFDSDNENSVSENGPAVTDQQSGPNPESLVSQGPLSTENPSTAAGTPLFTASERDDFLDMMFSELSPLEQENQQNISQDPTSSPQNSAVPQDGAKSALTFPEWGEGANTAINHHSASSDNEYILNMGKCRQYLEYQDVHGYKSTINIFNCSYMTNTLKFPINSAFIANLGYLVSALKINIIDLRGAQLNVLDGNRLFTEIINISIQQKTSQFSSGNLFSVYIDEPVINSMSYGRENGNLFYIPWKHVFRATYTPPGSHPVFANNITLHIFKNGQEVPAQGENQIDHITNSGGQQRRRVTNYVFDGKNPLITGNYGSIGMNAQSSSSKRARHTETKQLFFI